MTQTRSNLAIVLTLLAGISAAAPGYDPSVAAYVLNTVTGRMDRQFFATTPDKIEAPALLERLARKEPVTLLDIRTAEEQGVIGLTHPHVLSIPMHELFRKENLDRLPAAGNIVVVCHSGNRAAEVTALLKTVGFRDVVYVNGGLIALVTGLTPKTVPVP